MEIIVIIITIVSGFIAILWAVDAWLLPKPIIRPWILRRKMPVILQVYAPLDKVTDIPTFSRGMAVGILAKNISQDIEKNTVIFRQQMTENEVVTVRVSGSQITGGSHAPGPTVLTLPIPNELKAVKGKLSIEVKRIESDYIAFNVVTVAQPPTLEGFGTPFASKRSTSGAPGKRIVIGGYGFSTKEDENRVVFTTVGRLVKESKPEKVRGDALLGVAVPDLTYGKAQVQVQTTIGGNNSPFSNALDFLIVSVPVLRDIDPYVRPGEDLKVRGSGFDKTNEENNWVILEPYQERKPISLRAKSVPTENEIVVRIPRRSLPPGPYDVRVVVDGNYSANTLILDIQKSGKKRPLEERKS